MPAYWPGGVRHIGGASSAQALARNVGTCRPDAAGRVLEPVGEGRTPSSGNCEGQSTDAGHRGGPPCSSDEALVMRVERRGRVVRVRSAINRSGEESMSEPSRRTSRLIFPNGSSGRRIRESRPTRERPASTAQSIADFERDLKEPVQALESAVVGELLPAAGAGGGDTQGRREGGASARCAHGRGPDRPDGGQDVSGADGGAGVPPGLLRLSSEAVGVGRGRGLPGAVLGTDWVIDLDIQAFFDTVPHEPVLGRSANTPISRGSCCMWSAGSSAAPATRTARWSPGIEEPRKARRSHRCWRTCSCIMRSTCGWRE